MNQPISPPPPRITVLDALRGFALGGIFLVNIMVMSKPGGFTDGPAHSLVNALFYDKFYVLFSFLFGYSLTMQFRSAARARVSPTARTVRRCSMLMAIGLLHIAFLFTGDVLFGYGVAGLALLALSRLRSKTALIVAAVPFTVSLIAITVMNVLHVDLSMTATQQETALAAIRSGWLDAASYRWNVFAGNAYAFLMFGLLNALPMFVIGMVAGKARLLEQPERYLPLLPRVQWIGFTVATPICVLAAVTDWPLAGPAHLVAPLLSAAYAATILRLLHHNSTVQQVFAPAGKIAATNYIGQSLIAAVIFTGYGFALAGKLSEWAVLGIAVVVYAAQLAVSAWYVRRHRYGPIEWVLRAATYGTLRPGRSKPRGRHAASTG
ncbi:DUF418 domain-containing protein [Nocardia sp. NPDC051756]|uniref:DUF418 domain-containing protein n=1 Tax=Nocardia sp. NPDC051756 TaxID=3154751 RepID=UPI003439F89C